jgi:hypothetical protein
MSREIRSPVYQIDFTAVDAGKRIASTKRRIRWRFGFTNQDALAAGETGTACRGEEHDITLIWSLTSGKRLVLADGQEVHYSSNRTQMFDFSWTMRGNHVLKIIAHATAPLNPSHNFRQYDFFVDGMSFFNMPKVHRLGLIGTAPSHDAGAFAMAHSSRTGTYSNYNMGGSYYGPGAPRNDTVSPNSPKRSIIVEMEAPHNAQEEEAYLQEAIKASLSEANESQNNVPKPAPPQEQDLLLDFGSEPEPQSSVPALTAGNNMNYSAAIVTAPPSAASQYALGPSPGYGYPSAAVPSASSADPFAPAPYNNNNSNAPDPSQYFGAQMTSPQAQYSNAPAAQYSTPAFSSPPPAAPAPSFAQPAAVPAFSSPPPAAPVPSFAQPTGVPSFSSPPPAAPVPSFSQPSGVSTFPSQPGTAPETTISAPPSTFVPPPASPESSLSTPAPAAPAPVLTMAPQAKGLGADANAAYAKFASMDQFDLVKPKGNQRANPFDTEPASAVDNNVTLGSLKSMQQGSEKKEVMKSHSMVVSQNQNGNWGGAIASPPQGYGMMGSMNQGMQQQSQYGMHGGYGQQQQPQYAGMGMQQQQPNYGQTYQQPMNQGMQQQPQYGMPQQQFQYGMPQQQSQYGMPQQQF